MSKSPAKERSSMSVRNIPRSLGDNVCSVASNVRKAPNSHTYHYHYYYCYYYYYHYYHYYQYYYYNYHYYYYFYYYYYSHYYSHYYYHYHNYYYYYCYYYCYCWFHYYYYYYHYNYYYQDFDVTVFYNQTWSTYKKYFWRSNIIPSVCPSPNKVATSLPLNFDAELTMEHSRRSFSASVRSHHFNFVNWEGEIKTEEKRGKNDKTNHKKQNIIEQRRVDKKQKSVAYVDFYS